MRIDCLLLLFVASRCFAILAVDGLAPGKDAAATTRRGALRRSLSFGTSFLVGGVAAGRRQTLQIFFQSQ